MARVFMLLGAVTGARTINSLSVNGRCVTWQTFRDIDPDELVNMDFLVAFDRTQAAPQSVCLNEGVSENM